MNGRRYLVLIILVLVYGYSFALKAIDYQPKQLVRQLKKAGIENINEVTIVDFDSILGDIFIEGQFYLLPRNDEALSYLYIGRTKSCRANGCTATLSNAPKDDNSEYFDYYILFDKNKSVAVVQIYNYQATHGHEVTARGWLKQFIGFDGKSVLEVGKNIDSISGATISVYALTNDVQIKTELLKKL